MTDSRLAASWVSRRQLCHTRSAAAAIVTAGGSHRNDLSPERERESDGRTETEWKREIK